MYKDFDSHKFGWHWRRHGSNGEHYVGRAGKATVTEARLYLKDDTLYATIKNGVCESPHVQVKDWDNFEQNVPLGNGQFDNQQRFRLRARTCAPIARVELTKKRVRVRIPKAVGENHR